MLTHRHATGITRRLLVTAMVSTLLGLTACGSASADNSGSTAGSSGPVTLHLGYLPNLTHAPALLGVSKGYFQQALGGQVTLKTQTFNAGPAEVEALLAGSLDAAFMGPSAAITAFTQTHGEAVRVVSGATVGGASLIVRPAANIHSAADLRGKTLASPQLGNTQDVSLRDYLLNNGLHTNAQTGNGDVRVINQANADILTSFKAGSIDGAWVPEPNAARLVDEFGGSKLVDEATLWPNGQFATTVLVVTTSFLNNHSDVVTNLLKGESTAITSINGDSAGAATASNAALKQLTGKALATKSLNDAWKELSFTLDPLAGQTKVAAQHSVDVGITKSADIQGIEDLRLLNKLLQGSGRPTVSDGGLSAAS